MSAVWLFLNLFVSIITANREMMTKFIYWKFICFWLFKIKSSYSVAGGIQVSWLSPHFGFRKAIKLENKYWLEQIIVYQVLFTNYNVDNPDSAPMLGYVNLPLLNSRPSDIEYSTYIRLKPQMKGKKKTIH